MEPLGSVFFDSGLLEVELVQTEPIEDELDEDALAKDELAEADGGGPEVCDAGLVETELAESEIELVCSDFQDNGLGSDVKSMGSELVSAV